MITKRAVTPFIPVGFSHYNIGTIRVSCWVQIPENAYKPVENSGDPATIVHYTNTRGGRGLTIAEFFPSSDLSIIPQSATIEYIECSVKLNGTEEGYPGPSIISPITLQIGNNSGNTYGTSLTLTSGDSATTIYTLSADSITLETLPELGLCFSSYLTGRTSVISGQYSTSIRMYGATLSVVYSYNEYSINCSSSSQNITLVPSLNEVEEGGSVTYTLTAPDISKVKVLDNGVDITSNFTGSNGVYTCTVNNISADHNVVASLTCSLSIKLWGEWQTPQQIYVKARNGWDTMEDYSYSVLSELLPKDRIYKTEKLDDQGQE